MHQLRGSQAELEGPLSPAGAPPEPYPLRVFFWCMILVLGLLNVWARRNEVSPDSISYIEIAWATARGGLHQIVNGYWSPLYPFLLSLVFRSFHPPVQWEFTAAHLLNFAVYVASLATFEVFLKELILARHDGKSLEKPQAISTRTMWIWGYVFFLWASYFWLGPVWVTPDLCVAVLAYLATALLFRIRRGRGGWLVFAGLGALLSLGYLAKAAMFPLTFVFLFSTFCLCRIAGASLRGAALRTLLATAVFAGFAAPLVLTLSAMKGRPTFGDSGALNYAMYVNGAPRWVYWHGQPPGTGVPAHPMRQLSYDPALYEFAQPVPGSYPLWYDPSYWYEGISPHFSLRGEAWALYRAANVYLKLISRTGALYAAFLALALLARKAGSWEFEGKRLFWVWLPNFAAFGMYALVHVEQRFLGGFALMLLMGVLSSLRVSERAGAPFRRRAILLAGLAPGLAVGWAAARDLYDVARNKPDEHWVIAQQLHAMGIPPGTEVGYIGTGLEASWAHLAGVRIIAEVPESELQRFAAADAERRQRVLALFSSIGAIAVVTRNADAANPADGWRQIPRTHHFIWQQPWLIAAPEKK